MEIAPNSLVSDETIGRTDFSDQLRRIIKRFKPIGYILNVMRQSSCLVINPITVYNIAALFNYTPGLEVIKHFSCSNS